MIPPAHKPAINYRMQLSRTRCLLFIILVAHTIENIRRNFIISCVYTRPLYRCVQCNFLSWNTELWNTFCAWAGGSAANYPTGLCFVYEFASEEISLSRCRILFFRAIQQIAKDTIQRDKNPCRLKFLQFCSLSEIETRRYILFSVYLFSLDEYWKTCLIYFAVCFE